MHGHRRKLPSISGNRLYVPHKWTNNIYMKHLHLTYIMRCLDLITVILWVSIDYYKLFTYNMKSYEVYKSWCDLYIIADSSHHLGTHVTEITCIIISISYTHINTHTCTCTAHTSRKYKVKHSYCGRNCLCITQALACNSQDYSNPQEVSWREITENNCNDLNATN